MKAIIVVFIIALAVMGFAQNPDGRGYFEPVIRLSAGPGHASSDLISQAYKWDLDQRDFGLGVNFLMPLRENISLRISPFYSYVRLENLGQSVKQSSHRFGAEIGFKFYLQ